MTWNPLNDYANTSNNINWTTSNPQWYQSGSGQVTGYPITIQTTSGIYTWPRYLTEDEVRALFHQMLNDLFNELTGQGK